MNIENIKALGLWPDSKKTTTNKNALKKALPAKAASTTPKISVKQ